jgi:phosphatidylinositol glycan class B
VPLLVVLATWHVAVTVLAGKPWHPDEHFQVLEFAWARAGLAPLSDLPWEYAARIRPTLQPTMALVVLRGLRAVGIESPFTWVVLLRLGTLLVAFGALLRVAVVTAPMLPTVGARRVAWLAALGAWFAPMLLSRFTSENVAGALLALAAAETVAGTAAAANGRWRLLAGVCAGAAIALRYQMAFPVMALGGWLLWRGEWGQARRLAAGAVVMVLLSLACDWWFYGAPTVTPWHYFRVNIVEGVASTFGTSPWWAYVLWAPLWTAPPVGLLLVAAVLAGLAAAPRSAWSWTVLGYLLPHSLLAHKELRFLFPLLYLVPPVAAAGWAALPQWSRSRRLVAIAVAQNLVLGALLLTPSIHRGKEFDWHFYRLLWREAERTPSGPLYVVVAGGDPYRVWDWAAQVYRHPRVVGVPLAPGTPLPAPVAQAVAAGRVFVVATSEVPPCVPGVSPLEPIYIAEAGYRTMFRAAGAEDAPLLRFLERVDRWEGSAWKRRVYRATTATATWCGPGRRP